MVSSTPRPHFTPGKDPVPILQEAGWAPGPVWTGGKSRPHRGSITDRPARSQSLCRLSYRAHFQFLHKVLKTRQTHELVKDNRHLVRNTAHGNVCLEGSSKYMQILLRTFLVIFSLVGVG